VIEITTKQKTFKTGKKRLLTRQSQVQSEAEALSLSKKKKKQRVKTVKKREKKDFFS